MSIVATSGESNFQPCPTGIHLARCYSVIDLGTQTSDWQGETKRLPKIMLQFEVHGEDDEGRPTETKDGAPMSISKNYTLSLGEKANLRRDLTSWRGRDFTAEELRGFSLKNVVGVWAMISVTRSMGSNGREYTNISGIMPMPSKFKGSTPKTHNEPRIFSLDDPDMALFDSFSDYLKAKIQEAPEWQARGQKPKVDPIDDEVPF